MGGQVSHPGDLLQGKGPLRGLPKVNISRTDLQFFGGGIHQRGRDPADLIPNFVGRKLGGSSTGHGAAASPPFFPYQESFNLCNPFFSLGLER